MIRMRAAWLLCIVALAGCAGSAPRIGEFVPRTPAQVELTATPFFPQREYQCGPAALATVLAASGVPVTADELVPAIYLPERRGSLQTELVAATRVHGRLPYVLPAQAEALFAELAAGRPVLVLQKQGAGPWPAWHYAVVNGYDRERNTVLLRSGTNARLAMSARRFMWTWDRAGRWALSTLPPGELPAAPDLGRYVEAAAGLEAVGQTDDAARSYQAAATRWPDASLPWLGLANVAYARGDFRSAEERYRDVLRRDPGDVVARNNRAEALFKLGCAALARREIATAREGAAGSVFEQAVAETASRIEAGAAVDVAGCPTTD
jgi:tetratricopeptide (TPR) repeat protein